MRIEPYAAVVLAGGAARRLGGAVKPMLPVGGRPMLDRVLAAVADAAVRIVVGPAELSVPPGVLMTREQPPGGGPVAGAAAGLRLVPSEVPLTALLAADLPLLSGEAIATLRAALTASATVAAAAFLDDTGRLQPLCGMWRSMDLRTALRRLAAARGCLSGASMRALSHGVRIAEVPWLGVGSPPWFDCDTDADIRRAEGWVH